MQQFQEQALTAKLTERQSWHFNRLMEEIRIISNGHSFQELEKLLRAGDRSMLQRMHDYIAKKEQIVEFLENKEAIMAENKFLIGDPVICCPSRMGGLSFYGKTGVVEEVDDTGEHVRCSGIDSFLVGFSVDDVSHYKDDVKIPTSVEKERVLDTDEFKDLKIGKKYIEKNGKGVVSIHYFVVRENEIMLVIDKNIRGERTWEEVTQNRFKEDYILKSEIKEFKRKREIDEKRRKKRQNKK